MDFFIIPGTITADYGPAPEGAVLLDFTSAAPFQGLSLTPACLAAAIRLHAGRREGGRRANLRRANLRGADLTGANLTGANLTGADLGGADLSEANLSGADLSGANLRWATLRGANLSWATLSWATLSGADLRGATLSGATLSGADLSWANLRGANLRGANLTGANLRGADLSGADLSGAVGLTPPEEEEANLTAAINAIAREPATWNQGVWHGDGFAPDTAPEVGACGTAHCLAGHLQCQLPLDHELRKVEAQMAGTLLAPRAAAAGWFDSSAHPDLTARVEAAKAKIAARQR